tara:strand:+ start:40 stop:399 length:360 start_codon:yes stop_codon:yes gene_type:complete
MNSCKQCNKSYVLTTELKKKGYLKDLCNSCSTTLSRRRRKQKAVDYKGGKCKICGYNKCNSSLQFHHIEPGHKDFGFSAKGWTRAWEKQKIELDKCILLCANCHGEVHAGIISADSTSV